MLLCKIVTINTTTVEVSFECNIIESSIERRRARRLLRTLRKGLPRDRKIAAETNAHKRYPFNRPEGSRVMATRWGVDYSSAWWCTTSWFKLISPQVVPATNAARNNNSYFCSGPSGASGEHVSPPITGLQKYRWRWPGVSVKKKRVFSFFSERADCRCSKACQ